MYVFSSRSDYFITALPHVRGQIIAQRQRIL